MRADFMPDSKPWRERRQGKWIESHAAYAIVCSSRRVVDVRTERLQTRLTGETEV